MRRYAWRDGKLVELDTSYVPQPRIHLITDRAYENLSPVITNLARDKDGNVEVERVDISTRARHRQYMKDHDLALYDDFKPEWDRAAQKRADFALAKQDDRDIRQELEKQMYRVFDAPGIEERPKVASELDDSAALNPATDKRYEGPKDTSYPVVTEYFPDAK